MEDQNKPEQHKDRSLYYLAIGLGLIIIILGYFTFFAEEKKVTSLVDNTSPNAKNSNTLSNALEQSDQAVKNSLTKFIDAFYYDQNKGYFDPPSYFSNPVQTYYNFHNLTYAGLEEVRNKRLSDYYNLQQNWDGNTLALSRDGSLITATYNLATNYYLLSQGKQELIRSKVEVILKDGKIISLKELESNKVLSQEAPMPDTSITGASDVDKLYNVNTVSTKPEFPGGQNALLQYLQTNLKYPEQSRENDIAGKVYLSFVIEKDGSLREITIINGLDNACNEEATRVLQHSPRWEPGRLGGRPVRTIYTLSIDFRLEG